MAQQRLVQWETWDIGFKGLGSETKRSGKAAQEAVIGSEDDVTCYLNAHVKRP